VGRPLVDEVEDMPDTGRIRQLEEETWHRFVIPRGRGKQPDDTLATVGFGKIDLRMSRVQYPNNTFGWLFQGGLLDPAAPAQRTPADGYFEATSKPYTLGRHNGAANLLPLVQGDSEVEVVHALVAFGFDGSAYLRSSLGASVSVTPSDEIDVVPIVGDLPKEPFRLRVWQHSHQLEREHWYDVDAGDNGAQTVDLRLYKYPVRLAFDGLGTDHATAQVIVNGQRSSVLTAGASGIRFRVGTEDSVVMLDHDAEYAGVGRHHLEGELTRDGRARIIDTSKVGQGVRWVVGDPLLLRISETQTPLVRSASRHVPQLDSGGLC
jgi:hypothetical protein